MIPTEYEITTTVYTFALVNCKSFVIFTHRLQQQKQNSKHGKHYPTAKACPANSHGKHRATLPGGKNISG